MACYRAWLEAGAGVRGVVLSREIRAEAPPHVSWWALGRSHTAADSPLHHLVLDMRKCDYDSYL